MIERDRQRIHGLGRGAATAHRVHDVAVKRVVVKAPAAAEQLVTGKSRGKTYVYGEYMDILNEGTEL